MGSQVNFFLGRTDLSLLERTLRLTGDVNFIHRVSDSPHPSEVASLSVQDYGRDDLSLLIARPLDLGALRLGQIEGTRTFTASAISHPVVELDRPFVAPGFIRAGRLYWTKERWLAGGGRAENEPQFQTWAASLLRKCRATLTKLEGSPYYAGPEALELRKTGVQFSNLDDPRG